MKNQITLDFCVWLQRNFDEILAEGPEWHGNLQQHLSRAQVAAASSEPTTSVQKQATLLQEQAAEWDTLRKIAEKTLAGRPKGWPYK